MNARANTAIDVSDANVQLRTAVLLSKSLAILDLMMAGAESDGDFKTVVNAACAVRDMIAEANQLNSWF